MVEHGSDGRAPKVHDGGRTPRSDGDVNSSGVVSAVRERARRWDLALVLVVPVVLVVVFALPRGSRLGLVLAYQRPTVVTAYTAHFVHLESHHLLGNLVMYGIVVPLAYALSLLSGRRRTFRLVFVTILLAFPFALSGLNIVVPRPRVGYGFSGVVMAFVGYLTLVLWEYLVVQFGRDGHRGHSPLLFFLVAGIIAMAGIPRSPASVAVLVLSGIGGVLYLRSVADVRRPVLGPLHRHAGRTGYVGLAVCGLSVVVVAPFLAFPSSPTGDGTVLNLYAHFLGYALGYLVPYLALGVTGVRPEGTPRRAGRAGRNSPEATETQSR